jgi:2-polyprenyl-6-methoxyphenol hydroxylase-like FAD-dependent oxidoreductase
MAEGILIVAGGPVGLALWLVLAHRGTPSLVLEARRGAHA